MFNFLYPLFYLVKVWTQEKKTNLSEKHHVTFLPISSFSCIFQSSILIQYYINSFAVYLIPCIHYLTAVELDAQKKSPTSKKRHHVHSKIKILSSQHLIDSFSVYLTFCIHYFAAFDPYGGEVFGEITETVVVVVLWVMRGAPPSICPSPAVTPSWGAMNPGSVLQSGQ